MIIPSLYAGFTGVAEVPRIDIVPTAHFKRPNLLSREPHLGKYDSKNDVYKPKMMNASLGTDTSRRVIMCKNDLRVKVGRPAKDKQVVNPALKGIGRNTYCEFSRPPNNMPVLKMADSQNASKISKL